MPLWLFVIAIALFPSSSVSTPIPVVIDTDVDVDDMAALHYNLLNPDVDVKLITVSGNSWTHLSMGVTNVYNVLQLLNRTDVDVGVGATYALDAPRGCKFQKAIPQGGVDGWYPGNGMFELSLLYGSAAELPQHPRGWQFDDATALEKLRQLLVSLRKNNTQVKYLAIGGMTALGMYLRAYPEDYVMFEGVYIMGGAINHPGNIFTDPNNTVAEFNIYVDAEAMSVVLKSGVRVVLVPLDATDEVKYTHRSWARLTSTESTPLWLGRLLFRMRTAMNMSDEAFVKTIFPWDSFTSAIMGDSGVFNSTVFQKLNISVVTDVINNKSQVGRTYINNTNGTEITVAMWGDEKVFWDSWFRIVGGATTPHPPPKDGVKISIVVGVVIGVVVSGVILVCGFLYVRRRNKLSYEQLGNTN